MTARQRIVILGSGFAGLEAAFLLRTRMRDAAQLTVVSEREAFTFRPNAIYVPFDADPSDLVVNLAKPFDRRGITFCEDRVVGVDPDAHQVALAGGRKLGYDKLVIATGAAMRPEEVPGLAEYAATIWTPQSTRDVRKRFERVLAGARAGRRSRVLFVIPPNNKCAGPLYEVVTMFETWLRRQHAREQVEIAWSTCEQSYIQAFGPRLHEVVTREFERRGIDGHTDEVVSEIARGEARYADGSTRSFDQLVAFPPYVAAVRYAALPQVPLELTGDPARPVAVRADADGDYEVGTGSTWRLGKKMLAMTVPMRLRAGDPFHAGLAWQTMDVGLKGMSA